MVATSFGTGQLVVDAVRRGLPALILLAYPSISRCNLQRRRRISGKQLIDKILAFPHDALRQDLEQIIRYHISLGCDDIPDEYDDETFDGSLFNALMLIAEVGTPDSSLDAVIDVMRQSCEFIECHICDCGHQVFPPTLYKLGQHQLDRL